MKKIQYPLLAVLAVCLLAGCGSSEVTLSGNQREAVLAFSEAKTDHLLASMNASDYPAFIRDFDEEMLSAVPQSEFESMKKDRDDKLGLYVSRQVNRVVQNGEFYAVIYDAIFEKEEAVTVRVVFRVAEPHEVSGLWFDK